MVEKVWGNAAEVPYNAKRVQVDGGAEIAKGNFAYVDLKPQNATYTIPVMDYWDVVNGDVSYIKNDIESKLSGAKAVWIRVSWTSSSLGGLGGNFVNFHVEALVKNVDAGLTGIEIVAIIFAVTFLIAIVTAAVLLLYATWEIFGAAAELPPAVTIGVGLVILVLVGVGVLLLFGVKFSGGKKGFKITGRK